jgi:C-methyltransferase-like protein/putative zinc binding protein
VLTATPGPCRSCGTSPLARVLDLGHQPVADWLVGPDSRPEAEPRYPLTLELCEACGLLQLGTFDDEDRVRGHQHSSATSSTVADHDVAWADDLVRRLELGPTSVVADAPGGGDGVARALTARGVQVVPAPECAPALADLVMANHSLAHALDLDRALGELIAPLRAGGTLALEFHHGARLLTDTQFDLICHPHRTYLSVLPLVRALARHGFRATHASEIPVHGGSVRLYAERGEGPAGPTVEHLIAGERALGLDGIGGYRSWAQHIAGASAKIRRFLLTAQAEGQTVIGYGAPSRASTLLNHCGLTSAHLRATVDRSAGKQGRALPGCGVPIHSPQLITELKPDFVLILAWTLAEEIMEQMAHVRAWGGRFVVPLPDLKVLP